MTGKSRRTYSKRTANINDEYFNKKRCVEKVSTTDLLAQKEFSTHKAISFGNSGAKFRNDIRAFLLPVSSSSISSNQETVLPDTSSSSSQIKRKKRRLRLTLSETKEISAKGPENHGSPTRLIQQTITRTGKELMNCKTCGMVYAFWEEKQHNFYHQKLNLEFLPILKCQKATIYEQKFENNILHVQVLNRNMEKSLRILGEKAIQFSSSNGLEMENIESYSLWSLIPNPHDTSDHIQVPRYKLYMMFLGSQLIALLLAERIGYAYHICSEGLWQKKHECLKSGTGALREAQISNRNNDCQKAFMSIERLWVHQSHQRKGLAKMIINEARKDFLYPLVLPKNEVAISWPTCDGDKFFKHYFSGVFDLSPYLINLDDSARL